MNIVDTYVGKIGRSLKERGFVNSVMFIPRRYFQTFRFRKFDFGGLEETSEMDVPE